MKEKSKVIESCHSTEKTRFHFIFSFMNFFFVFEFSIQLNAKNHPSKERSKSVFFAYATSYLNQV